MLKLAVNNPDYTLVSEINRGTKKIDNLAKHELAQLNNIIVSYPEQRNELFTITRKALSPLVSAYQYDDRNPYWFTEDTTFDDDIWRYKLLKTEAVIDFNIALNDGKKLTSKKHRPLLNAFKYWLIAQGNPFYNGGKLLKPESVNAQIKKTLALIDALLVNAKVLNLAQRHLMVLRNDLAIDLMIRLAEGGVTDGLYNYKSKVEEYLLTKIDSVTDEELESFLDRYPYANRTLHEDEKELSLTEIQRQKACCYLFNSGAYKKKNGYAINVPNNSYFGKLYDSTLSFKDRVRTSFNDLRIAEDPSHTEKKPVPVKDLDSSSLTDSSVSKYLSIFKTIMVVNGRENTSSVPEDAFENATIKRIRKHVTLKQVGRFSTLPVPVVFKAIKDAYEYAFKYADDILESIYKILLNKPTNNSGDTNLVEYKREGFKRHVMKPLLSLGVQLWSVDNGEEKAFQKRRDNLGVADLFNVLIGAIQVVVGATMARRQGELIDLDSVDCLLPKNSNPINNPNQAYELIFDNKKTGIGGQLPLRETLSKPILNSVAGFVYKLQLFNKRLKQKNICTRSDLGLFTYLDSYRLEIKPVDSTRYNFHLNTFCDYFETEEIEYVPNDFCRFYIRQHQLRRFFAMVFFWSKSYDGLDTLRHFFGHSDAEHLYHYITEGITGDVLVGIKAKCLLDGLNQNYIENIEKLTPILKERFYTNSLSIKSIDEIIEEYDDQESFHTVPHLSHLKPKFGKDSVDDELCIAKLLLDGTIDLQPHFFTVKDEEGNDIRDFNLIMHITDLEEE